MFTIGGAELGLSTDSRNQLPDVSFHSGTNRRHMKGHRRNRSNESGGGGGSGSFPAGTFIPGHNRSESVLSKISRLSVRTLGWSELRVIIVLRFLSLISWGLSRSN